MCEWFLQLNIPVWKTSCGELYNKDLVEKLGGKKLHFCPNCGCDIEWVVPV